MQKIVNNGSINKKVYKDIITKSYNELIPCLVKNIHIYTINDKNLNLYKINSNSTKFEKAKIIVKHKKIWDKYLKQTNICRNKSLYPKNRLNRKNAVAKKDKNPYK